MVMVLSWMAAWRGNALAELRGCRHVAAGDWQVPLPGDMEDLIERLLLAAQLTADASAGDTNGGSNSSSSSTSAEGHPAAQPACSNAFREELHAFLTQQVRYLGKSCSNKLDIWGLLMSPQRGPLNSALLPSAGICWGKPSPACNRTEQSQPTKRVMARHACMRAQVAGWREVRQKLGLPHNARGARALEATAAAQSVTAAELAAFVRMCAVRYERKRMEPGARRAPLSHPARHVPSALLCLMSVPTVYAHEAGLACNAGRCMHASASVLHWQQSASASASTSEKLLLLLASGWVLDWVSVACCPARRLHGRRVWRAEHRRAGDADDAEDVPLCGRREHERDAGRAAHQGDHQRRARHLHARHQCALRALRGFSVCPAGGSSPCACTAPPACVLSCAVLVHSRSPCMCTAPRHACFLVLRLGQGSSPCMCTAPHACVLFCPALGHSSSPCMCTAPHAHMVVLC